MYRLTGPVLGPHTGYKGIAEHWLFTKHKQLLFTRVVALAEKEGRPVHCSSCPLPMFRTPPPISPPNSNQLKSSTDHLPCCSLKSRRSVSGKPGRSYPTDPATRSSFAPSIQIATLTSSLFEHLTVSQAPKPSAMLTPKLRVSIPCQAGVAPVREITHQTD